MINASGIRNLLAQGEGIQVEFKSCRDALNRDVYESVCAFLNRSGGHLLLGVRDDGEVTGVVPEAVEQLKKDFVTALNNPQKITPPFYLSIDPASFSPFPKNPVIARFFKEIGWADELGSGVRNLFHFSKIYSGEVPELTEGDVFKIRIAIPDEATDQATPQVTDQATDQATEQEPRKHHAGTMQAEMILEYCIEPRSRVEIQEHLGLKNRDHFRKSILLPLIESGQLLMTLPDKPSSPKQQFYTALAINVSEQRNNG